MLACHVQPIDPSTQFSARFSATHGRARPRWPAAHDPLGDGPARPASNRDPSDGLAYARGVRRLFATAGWRGRLVAFEQLWRSHGADAVLPLMAVKLPTDVRLALTIVAPADQARPPVCIQTLVDRLGRRAVGVITALALMARRNGLPDPDALLRLGDQCVEAREAVARALADCADAREASLLRWLPNGAPALVQVVAAWFERHGSAAALVALATVRTRFAASIAPEGLAALRRAEAEIRVRTYRASAVRLATVAPTLGRAAFRREQRPRPVRRSVRMRRDG